MPRSQLDKARAFRDLHASDDLFLMPNAWSAGSARVLAECGFAAIGTTSAGIAFSRAIADYSDQLDRDIALLDTAAIAAATELPVSADSENGYGDTPEQVAESLRLFVKAGAVGVSIEDHDVANQRLFDRDQATERVAGARAGCDATGLPIVLTARAECFLLDHPNPLRESIERANLYREAGADCLYVPAVTAPEDISTLVREIDAPINVVMGLAGAPLSVAQLRDLGVRRVSVGGSLARATFGLIRRAGEEMLRDGTFSYASGQIPDAELCELFSRPHSVR
jgi:2-methylisocitrate lyase-like PEP mutase family enzyme